MHGKVSLVPAGRILLFPLVADGDEMFIGLMKITRFPQLSAFLVISTLILLIAMPTAGAVFEGSNGLIAFGRLTDKKNTDLWTVDPSTGDKVRLTETSQRKEGMPDWSPDGTKVAYSRCGTGQFSNWDIWVMNADGSDQTRLTFTEQPDPFLPSIQETWPTWSPDGEQIAYTSNELDSFQDIWVMNADGSDPTRLTVNEAFDAFPEWSPDGSLIAFSSDRLQVDDIWVMEPDGDKPERLTRGQGVDERPDWSPDGTRITFSRNSNIWIMDSDGENALKLTRGRTDFAPTYSPNGKAIAFNRYGEGGRTAVWRMRADGTKARKLSNGVFDFAPDWQPVIPSG